MALTDAKIRAAKHTDKAYKLTDGAGMFLLVHPNGSRYWRLRYRILPGCCQVQPPQNQPATEQARPCISGTGA